MCQEWSGRINLNYTGNHESHTVYKIAYPKPKLQTYEKEFSPLLSLESKKENKSQERFLLYIKKKGQAWKVTCLVKSVMQLARSTCIGTSLSDH